MSGWSGQSAQALARDRDGAVVVAGVVGGLGGVVVLEGRGGAARRRAARRPRAPSCPGSAATAERHACRPRRARSVPAGASSSSLADRERRAAAEDEVELLVGPAAPVVVSSWDSISSSPRLGGRPRRRCRSRSRPARGAAGSQVSSPTRMRLDVAQVGVRPVNASSRRGADSMRRRSSAPRPAATARAARASVSSTPRAAASSSSSWRSSPSRAVRAKSHPKSSQGEDRALDHHDRARGVLVGPGRDAVRALARRVDPEEDVAAEDEDVAEDGAREAHGDDVAQAREVAEPGRLGQRPEQRHPHVEAARHEAEVLQRVDGVVMHGALVEVGHVPQVEVQRPQGEGDERVGEHAQSVEEARSAARARARAR